MPVRRHAAALIAATALATASCGGSTPRHAPPPPPLPVDAGSELDAPAEIGEGPLDAPAYEGTAAPDGRAYRKLVLPRPLVLGAPTPAGSRCLPKGREASLQAHERSRQRAALDAEIRKRGWTPLSVVAMGDQLGANVRPGGITRGPNDERLMMIAGTSGCVPEAPIVAMTAQHEVFQVNWNLTPKQTRTVKFCENSCYEGCGMPQHMMFGAEVPADAKLAPSGSQRLDVTLDVVVEFGYVNAGGCLMP